MTTKWATVVSFDGDRADYAIKTAHELIGSDGIWCFSDAILEFMMTYDPCEPVEAEVYDTGQIELFSDMNHHVNQNETHAVVWSTLLGTVALCRKYDNADSLYQHY